MELQKLAMIFYILALTLATMGSVLSLIGLGFAYGNIIFIYCPIILIVVGLLLPIIMKE
ncbi:MAG: hypothetical protein ACFFC9_16255 [Promethearchaeota archaeon]